MHVLPGTTSVAYLLIIIIVLGSVFESSARRTAVILFEYTYSRYYTLISTVRKPLEWNDSYAALV